MTLDLSIAPVSVRFDAPYVGLLPFSENKADYFFGRTFDIEIAATNLRATPLTVFYGTSGVGKSSLINAGVIPYLRRMSTVSILPDEPPEFILVYMREWAMDPLEGLKHKIPESVREILKSHKIPKKRSDGDTELQYITGGDVNAVETAVKSTRDMVTLLTAWTTLTGTKLLIIFDQFEDFFRKAEFRSGTGSFGDELPKAIRCKDLPVNFMFSIRDDSVSKLDFFKDKIPDLMRNTLRLEHLDRESTDEAIRKPIVKYNEINESMLDGRPFGIEDALVTQLIEDLKVGNNDFDTDVQINIELLREQGSQTDEDYKVETPFLQIVMITLWEDGVTQETRRLTFGTLTRLGGVKEIVKTHLDKVIGGLLVNEQAVLAEFIHFMVARDRKNAPLSAAELANWADRPDRTRDIENILEKMSTGDNRIFRAVSTVKAAEGSYFEVTHDALAPAILSWRARYKENKRVSETWSEWKKWGIRIGIVVFLVLFAFAAIGGWQTYQAWAKAYELDEVRKEAEQAKADEAKLQRKIDFQKKNEGQDQTAELFDLSVKLTNGSAEEKAAALIELKQRVDRDPLSPELEDSFIALLDNVDPLTRKQASEILGQKEPVIRPYVTLVFFDARQASSQSEMVKLIKGANLVVNPQNSIVGTDLPNTQVRYFHDNNEEKAAAANIAALLSDAGIPNVKTIRLTGYENQRPQQMEIWFAPDAMAVTMYVKTSGGGNINLRSAPNGKVIVEIPNGTKVERQICQARKVTLADGVSGRWCRVKYGEQSGWAFDGYLSR